MLENFKCELSLKTRVVILQGSGLSQEALEHFGAKKVERLDIGSSLMISSARSHKEFSEIPDLDEALGPCLNVFHTSAFL